MRSLATGNLALCWLAHGGFEAYINISNPPKWHDIAPGLLIAREAGAIATDTRGEEIKSEGDGQSVVVANNTMVHNELLELIRSI